LAQDFAQRYPLIDGQGNFGNVDGDNAAAYRYTEARMTEVASYLLAFPNLLANGSAGIAVGMATNIPPHNAAELCDAAIHLIKFPNAGIEKLVEYVQGPDFPTGGVIVDDRESIVEAYKTGRGGFRVRAKWEKEETGRGGYQIIITEIPYQVQKSRLIEKIAELLINRKLPLLGDIRDESAEDIRIVIEPKSRVVDPEILMESMFKLTELESRISLNMNVLSKGKVPKVMSLRDVGLLIAYLNIDEVIRIVRFEDEPKKSLIATFNLTDLQAESILNMRLRSLAKLEEFEIKTEHDKLSAEKSQIEALLGSEDQQWNVLKHDIGEVKKKFGKDTELGARRTQFGVAPEHDLDAIQEAMIEKEPVTVVLSQKGWIRAMKGHVADFSTLTFKEGDKLLTCFHAETTDKVILFTTGGKFFTLGADKLPGGRGHGDPVRVMVDMDNDTDIIAAGDSLAVVGDNRKLLIFAIDTIPEMGRGKGVRLQKYKDGGIKDVRVFNKADGLTWEDSAQRTHNRNMEELAEYVGERAQAGRVAPKGFPKNGKFSS